MKKKITYTDEPLGDIQVVEDFLPPPERLIFKEDEAKVADDKCVERELAKRRSRKVKAMRPGEVQSDEQAFRQILGRLEDDVGTILKLISKGKKEGFFPSTAPFWALLRMTFPIAEAVGDLIYDRKGQNLQSVLENEFEAVRAGYRGKAAILTLLFRHPLAHTDELRTLVIEQREVGWSASWSEQKDHLSLSHNVSGIDVIIHFDTTAFYEDLVAVCQNAMGKPWGGQIMKRYNGWLTFDVDNVDKKDRIHKSAIDELAGLQGPV